MANPPPSPPLDDTERIVGWKAIAAHIKMSERTAVRWARAHGMPVHRVAGSGRSAVFAWPHELDSWSRTAAATLARKEEGTDAGAALDQCVDEPGPPDTETAPAASSAGGEHLNAKANGIRWVWPVVALTAFGLLIVYLTANHVVGSAPPRTLPWKVENGAHGRPASPSTIELRLVVGSWGPRMVTVHPGDMVRVETATVALGLHSEVDGDRLRLNVQRLAPLGTGESTTHVLARDLVQQKPERIEVLGQSLSVTWLPSPQGAADATKDIVKPCCLECEGLAVCGIAVTSACGACRGEARK